MKALILSLLWASTALGLTCTGSADSGPINTAIAAGGTLTLSGTCALGSTPLQINNIIVINGTATLSYTGSGYGLRINVSGTSGSPIDISGITLNGAGIDGTIASLTTPQSWINMHDMAIHNVTNGSAGINQEGYFSHVTIQRVDFNTISTVPIGSVTTSTNVENGFGGLACNYPTVGANTCFGIGIDLENGSDNVVIDSNTFNFTLGDAIRAPNVYLISSGSTIRIAANNQITNNTFTNIHRMGVELNGGGGCIGSCQFGNYAMQTGRLVQNNYIHNWLAPYAESFAWAVGDQSTSPTIVNNAAVATTGNGAFGYENSWYGPIVFQGNTVTANSAHSWTAYIETGNVVGSIVYQNNYLAGAITAGSGGGYFGQEGTCVGCWTDQYNVTAATCDTASNCDQSNLSTGIASFSNNPGTAVLSTWVVSQVAIRNVQFFLDSSVTPFATQAISNINTGFTSDRKWNYSQSLNTSSLSGSHTIKAVATDLIGGTSTQTQTFTPAGGSTEVTSLQSLITSHGSIYFAFTTQTDSNGVRIRYGTVNCSGSPTPDNATVWLQTNFINNVPHAFAAFTIGGLASSTAYHICPEVTKNSGGTWSSGFDQVITTAALPSPHPAPPIAPLIFNTSEPSTAGYTHTAISTAAGFGTAYGTSCASWTAGTGQVFDIAPGTLINTAGPYSANCRPPDLHIVNVSDVTLPSTINWPNHGFSENDLIEFGRTYGLSVTYPVGGGCNIGFGTILTGGIQTGQRYQVHVVDANNIQPRCLPAYQVDPSVAPPTPPVMVWTSAATATGGQTMVAVAYKSTGTDVHGKPIWQRRMPTSPYAVTPQWIWQTTGTLPPEHTAVSLAWTPNLFIFQDPVANISSGFNQHPFVMFGDPDPNVEIPSGPYRVKGCEITTDNYNGHSSDPFFWSSLFYTYPWDDQVVFDRCVYHIPDGNREFRGWQWDGSNVAWVDSFEDGLTYPHSANVGLNLAQTGAHTLTIASGTSYTPQESHTLASLETVTLSGSGSGRVRAYFDMAASDVLTVAVPSGITASCSPVTCITPASSATVVEACSPTLVVNNPNDAFNSVTVSDFPAYGTGESSAMLIGCADVTSGTITTAGPANPWASKWNAEGDSHMIGGNGPGPYIFSDNYYDGCGITNHFDDSGGFKFRGNYTWNRNYNRQNLKYMFGSATTNNLYCGNRQPLEWKGGQYIEAIGNVFDGVWREIIPDSGFFALQPLNGGLVTDVNFRSSLLIHGSAALQGPTNTCGGTATSCGFSDRILLSNLLTYDIDGFKYTAHNPYGSNGNGLGWLNQFSAVQDIVTSHQTDATPNSGATPWMASNTSVAIEGYNDLYSIHWYNGFTAQITSTFGDGSGTALGVPPGCSGLANFNLMTCQFTAGSPSFLFGNLMLGGYTDSSAKTGQSTVAAMTTAYSFLTNSYLATGTVAGTESAVGLPDPTKSQFCLNGASPYKAGGSANGILNNMADNGIDCVLFMSDMGALSQPTAPTSLITTSGFTVSYPAPDAGVCWVDVSLSTDPFGLARLQEISDGGGIASRSVAVTGLASGIPYTVWVRCSGSYLMSQKKLLVNTK